MKNMCENVSNIFFVPLESQTEWTLNVFVQHRGANWRINPTTLACLTCSCSMASLCCATSSALSHESSPAVTVWRATAKTKATVQSHKEQRARQVFSCTPQLHKRQVSHSALLVGRHHLPRRILHNIMTKNLKMVGEAIQGQSSVGRHLARPRAYLSSPGSIKVNARR